MELVRFVFSSFWTWLGFFSMLLVVCVLVGSLADSACRQAESRRQYKMVMKHGRPPEGRQDA